ncbi:MAG TPA: FAD-binding protein, partial [Solirubrobacteraceae bacterium]|nr:FAD-binding protein [Solirubrobacteraceae bacterium]
VVGHAVPDDGLMIDLTPMGAVRVDPARRRAWVQGGALLGALDRAAQPHGLATTAGNVSHTGVGGLTLGGGMGWLARRHGLSCDNVVSFEVVTADGRVVRTSAGEHPDLFWGLRGGGGNFGIVTEFEFALHPVAGRTVVAELSFARDGAAPAVAAWRDLAAAAPREATHAATLSGDLVTLGFVWVGDPDAGRRLAASARAALSEAGRPVAERVTAPSYVELQRREDTVRGHALRRYWKGHYLRELTAEAIAALLARDGDLAPNVSLQSYGGAIADVPDDDTAFGRRDTAFELVAAAGWTDPAEDDARIGAARRYARSLDRFATGAYVNALADEGADGVRRAYPAAKLAALTALKDRYDPDNVFHLNQNIPPSRHRAPRPR